MTLSVVAIIIGVGTLGLMLFHIFMFKFSSKYRTFMSSYQKS